MYIFITLVFMTVPRHQHLGAFILAGKHLSGNLTQAYSLSCSLKTPDSNMLSPYGNILVRQCTRITRLHLKLS